jgi:hypothetical protein
MPLQQNSFTQLRVLLVLTDSGILAQSYCLRICKSETFRLEDSKLSFFVFILDA